VSWGQRIADQLDAQRATLELVDEHETAARRAVVLVLDRTVFERRPLLGLEATRERAGRNVDGRVEPQDPGVVFRFVLEEFLLIGIADPPRAPVS